MVGDLVQDDVPDLSSETVTVTAREPLDRAAKDRHLVRQHTRIPATSTSQRYAAIQTQQGLAGRRFLLDNDLHVRHRDSELGRQGVNRLLHQPLEHFCRVFRAPHPASVGDQSSRPSTASCDLGARCSAASATASVAVPSGGKQAEADGDQDSADESPFRVPAHERAADRSHPLSEEERADRDQEKSQATDRATNDHVVDSTSIAVDRFDGGAEICLASEAMFAAEPVRRE